MNFATFFRTVFLKNTKTGHGVFLTKASQKDSENDASNYEKTEYNQLVFLKEETILSPSFLALYKISNLFTMLDRDLTVVNFGKYY